ncbi:hypothetical protein ABIE65_003582 [Constrictibacter sp. MBR-5]|uniref:hypothetical protein n=1 Tax=Constrictibacter sp. MBR-5 TaxID=3156467 RepID=UPI0033983E8F
MISFGGDSDVGGDWLLGGEGNGIISIGFGDARFLKLEGEEGNETHEAGLER